MLKNMISIMKYTSISKFLTLKWSELEECVRNDRGGGDVLDRFHYRIDCRVNACMRVKMQSVLYSVIKLMNIIVADEPYGKLSVGLNRWCLFGKFSQ